MTQMSKIDKEISESASELVTYNHKQVTPILNPSSLLYREIIILVDNTFGLPDKYTKVIMHDYEDRRDILINFWVPDPNCKSDMTQQSNIVSYRYENNKVTVP
jgi:hypothetical protein